MQWRSDKMHTRMGVALCSMHLLDRELINACKLCSGRPCIQDKMAMYLGRMHLLLQRLKRNRNFSRPAFAGIKAASRDYVEARGSALDLL